MNITEQRFWDKVQKTDGCWVWTGAKRNKGYGAFTYRVGDRLIQGRAHRYSYELHKGAIPPGLWVLHKCDNPACVNPEHLFLGTSEDNIQDMVKKGRHVSGGTHCGSDGEWKRGEIHHAAKLTEDNVREMRRLHIEGGWSFSQLGKRFGVNTSAAYKIVKRKLWKHVE